MQVNLYLQGDVTPILYDYDMDLDGVLVPNDHRVARNKGICSVLLERGDKVPTAGQSQTINTIKTINPNWDVQFYFQRRSLAAARK